MRDLPITAEEITERVGKGWARTRRGPFAPSGNRASEIGHPCARWLVCARTKWELRETPTRLYPMFDGGNMIEQQAIRELKQAGFKVIETQVGLQDKSLELTGALDFLLGINGWHGPCEVKGLNHYAWQKINSVGDLLDAKKPWLIKYPAQILSYLWLRGLPLGLFWLKSKLTFEGKAIFVDFMDHATYMDGIVEKIKEVNRHVAEGTMPEPMEYVPWLCDECDFLKAVCGPERVMGAEVTFEGQGRLGDLLEYREGLLKAGAKTLAKDLEKTEAEIKSYVTRERSKVACGGWLLEGKVSQRKGYSVDPSEQFRISIQKVAGNDD